MGKPFTYDWWHEHYKDVRGNIKTTMLYGVLGGLVTGFHFLVEGMPWWRHSLVDFLFALLALWLASALWRNSSAASSSPAPDQPHVFSESVLTPLQDDALRLAARLNILIVDFNLPDKPSFTGDKMADVATVSRHFEKVRAIEAKMTASYVLRFKPEAIRIHLRFAELGIPDRSYGVLADTAHRQEDILKMKTALREMAMRAFDL
jgi:hypothetical protein